MEKRLIRQLVRIVSSFHCPVLFQLVKSVDFFYDKVTSLNTFFDVTWIS